MKMNHFVSCNHTSEMNVYRLLSAYTNGAMITHDATGYAEKLKLTWKKT